MSTDHKVKHAKSDFIFFMTYAFPVSLALLICAILTLIWSVTLDFNLSGTINYVLASLITAAILWAVGVSGYLLLRNSAIAKLRRE